MITIQLATTEEAAVISNMAITTFKETWGHFYDHNVVDNYIKKSFNLEQVKKEIASGESEYYVAMLNSVPAAYMN